MLAFIAAKHYFSELYYSENITKAPFMNKVIAARPLSFISIAAIFSFLVITAGCKVNFIPDYDVTLSNDIVATAKTIDSLYLSIQDDPADQRQYEKYSDKYVAIEAELNSLLSRNKVRPLNRESTRIAEIAVQLWDKYRMEHKTDNKLSDGLIKLNRKTFSDLFYAMQVAEEAKNFSAPNP